MITYRSSGLYALHTAAQALFVGVGFWAWLAIFSVLYEAPDVPIDRYIVYGTLAIGALVIRAVFHRSAQSLVLRQRVGQRLRLALNQTLWVAAAILLFLVAAKDRSISRVFLFSWLPVLYALLVTTNAALPGWLSERMFRGRRVEQTLVYAISPEFEHVVPWIAQQQRIGIKVIGCLSDGPLKGAPDSLPILGTTAELSRVLAETGATQLLVPELPTLTNVARHLVEACERRGVRLLVLSNLERQFGQPVEIVEEDGFEFVTLRTEPLESPFNRTAKRVVDVVISLPVVLFLLPFVHLLVWVCQRLQSPGPLLYRQPRAGFHGTTFEILKYRTMRVDNPDVAKQATPGDDRIYPAGRWFRRMSIDELPQFLNVLRGDMSVVGPRPHLAEHDEAWARVLRNYHVRSLVKPGITGLAQVRGFRGEATTEEAIRLRALSDIEYIESWSLTLDFLLVFRTFWQVFAPPKTAL